VVGGRCVKGKHGAYVAVCANGIRPREPNQAKRYCRVAVRTRRRVNGKTGKRRAANRRRQFECSTEVVVRWSSRITARQVEPPTNIQRRTTVNAFDIQARQRRRRQACAQCGMAAVSIETCACGGGRCWHAQVAARGAVEVRSLPVTTRQYP